jgi:hypothetical protein
MSVGLSFYGMNGSRPNPEGYGVDGVICSRVLRKEVNFFTSFYQSYLLLRSIFTVESYLAKCAVCSGTYCILRTDIVTHRCMSSMHGWDRVCLEYVVI